LCFGFGFGFDLEMFTVLDSFRYRLTLKENLQLEWDEAFDVLEERERILKEKEESIAAHEEKLQAQIKYATLTCHNTYN
jgi:hypothetical protein